MLRRVSIFVFFIGIFVQGIHSQNAPLTYIPEIYACAGVNIDIPVTVSDFNDIGAISLTIHFNESSLVYSSFTNDSNFPGLAAFTPSPGVITLAGFDANSGISLPDNTVLFTLHFTFIDGFSNLSWYDDGPSCEYAGVAPMYNTLNDFPQEAYYINGSTTEIFPPTVLVQPESPDTIIEGSGTAIFNVVSEGQELEYQWQEYIDSWENIENGGVYLGALTETLNIVDPPIDINGNKYRCIVYGSCDLFAITDGLATLHVSTIVGLSEYDNKLGLLSEILIKAYPNPFKQRTVLKYFLPLAGDLSIEILDINGKNTVTLIDRFETEGPHSLDLDLYQLTPGVYTAIAQLRTEREVFIGTIRILCLE